MTVPIEFISQGMSYGLQQAGIKVLAGIDINPLCKDTYETNVDGASFICRDVFDFKEEELGELTCVNPHDDNLIFVGCSPCQYWSIIQTDKRKSEKTKNLLTEFARFIKYYQPGYVLVENVPGIIRRSVESGFDAFLEMLEELGYLVHYEIVNMNDYGVPQSRKRLSLVASRVSKRPIFPAKEQSKPTLKDAIKDMPIIRAGHTDSSTFFHSAANLSEKNKHRLMATKKNGGSWQDWAGRQGLQRARYKGSGFRDNYGRMCWEKPAPTITTKFYSISNGRFGHPTQTRAISIREGARIQTFPDSFVFQVSTLAQAALIIGNAVPPLFAQKLGEAIIESRAHHEP